jgi:hypothetical protein
LCRARWRALLTPRGRTPSARAISACERSLADMPSAARSSSLSVGTRATIAPELLASDDPGHRIVVGMGGGDDLGARRAHRVGAFAGLVITQLLVQGQGACEGLVLERPGGGDGDPGLAPGAQARKARERYPARRVPAPGGVEHTEAHLLGKIVALAAGEVQLRDDGADHRLIAREQALLGLGVSGGGGAQEPALRERRGGGRPPASGD